MATILFAKPIEEKIRKNLIKKVGKCKTVPKLCIVQVGDRGDSNIYVQKKVDFAISVGVLVLVKKCDEKISEKELIDLVYECASDASINGLIIQLPLPTRFDTDKILSYIPKNKDVDGLTESLDYGQGNIITPATARAVMSIFDFYNISIVNKKVLVLGRSKLAGEAIALLLKSKGAQVFSCDKNTNIEEVLRISALSDIIVSATGNPKMVDDKYVHEGQVVIDVGINKVGETAEGKNVVIGDVDFEKVQNIVKAVTPVPGGVGVLTVACLFENLLDLIDLSN